jgi:hypothetical protein
MYYFLVYDDHTHDHYLQQLLKSVREYGKEFSILVYDKKDIDSEFMEKNQSIFSLKRGGGYWLWKPYIILKTLIKLNEGDLLIYLDSKYFFTEPFSNWIENLLKNQDINVFRNKPNEPSYFMKQWCKMDVLQKYDRTRQVFEENELDTWAGCIFIRKTPFTVSFIQEWLNMCTYENITDSPSILPNHPEFIEHRHDQSLLSILIHKYNINTPFFERRYLQNVRCPYSYKDY